MRNRLITLLICVAWLFGQAAQATYFPPPSGGGVIQILAGANIFLNPLIGTGTVTISATGGSAGTVALINANASPAVIGTVVYCSSTGHFNFAKADAGATSYGIGLVADTSIASNTSGNIVVSGVQTATTTQWDAVVSGQSGGLTAGSKYYLDPVNTGFLTLTAPSTTGQYVEPIGIALSTTQLLLIPSFPILL